MENLEKNTNSNIEHLKKVYFWRSAFFGLIILAAGIAIGGASMSMVASRKIAQKPASQEYNSLMPRLIQVLGLKQQQINKIRPILDKHMQHLNEIREDARVDIANTLDQMNKEINPLLGDMQRDVWSNELKRIQRQLNPEPARNQQGGGRGLGRGAGQPGQGRTWPGQGGGGRLGRGAQQLNPRPNAGQRRAAGIQPPPAAPNSPLNNIIQNEIPSNDLVSNDMNE